MKLYAVDFFDTQTGPLANYQVRGFSGSASSPRKGWARASLFLYFHKYDSYIWRVIYIAIPCGCYTAHNALACAYLRASRSCWTLDRTRGGGWKQKVSGVMTGENSLDRRLLE